VAGASGEVEVVGLNNQKLGASLMNTPNLVALWEEHCRDEFEKRDVNATMATMVPQPYVNHIPTMTGGVGYEQLKRFYAYHFIPINPPDFRLTLISRTVGKDTLVDEFIVKFTHTTEIDWMLPGIPPTGRTVEIPSVAIIEFEGDKEARWQRLQAKHRNGGQQAAPAAPAPNAQRPKMPNGQVDHSLEMTRAARALFASKLGGK